VWHFVEQYANAFGKQIGVIPDENMVALQQYSWPGNVRELRNTLERAMIMANGPRLTVPVPTESLFVPRGSQKLVDVEKAHIRSVVESTGWRIRGLGGAADRLGLRPTTLETRMARLGMTRPTGSRTNKGPRRLKSATAATNHGGRLVPRVPEEQELPD
jgi:DNA-binding NtrC family response regulator